MTSTVSQISDTIILSLIRENNLVGWELLYDKYAAVLYGVICAHTADKAVAEQILTSLFIGLKQGQLLLKVNVALCACLLRYAHTNAREEFKKRGINYTEYPNTKNPILDLLCSQHTTIKKISAQLKLSKTEVKRHLQNEFFMLRPKNEVATVTRQQEGDNEYELIYD